MYFRDFWGLLEIMMMNVFKFEVVIGAIRSLKEIRSVPNKYSKTLNFSIGI